MGRRVEYLACRFMETSQWIVERKGEAFSTDRHSLDTLGAPAEGWSGRRLLRAICVHRVRAHRRYRGNRAPGGVARSLAV